MSHVAWCVALAVLARLGTAAAQAERASSPSRADAGRRHVDLRLPSPRPPRGLAMRAPTPAAPTPAAASSGPGPAPAPATAAPGPPAAEGAVQTPASGATAFASPVATSPALRRGDEDLAFRFDLGFALDGAAHSERPTLAGHTYEAAERAQVRSYGFGDVFLGSRGLILPNVTAFLSAYYRLASSLGSQPPIAEPRGFTNDLQIRSGWAELRDVGPRRWLSPLRIRAGRFYLYGPWVTHVDGLTIAWDGRAISGAATLGGRVAGLSAGARGGVPTLVGQLAVRADLTALRRRLPVIAGAELLTLPDHVHTRLHGTWQPTPTFGVGASARMIDGAMVHEQLSLRARLRDLNSLHAELAHRHGDDWRWDPSVVTATDVDPTGARRYLELGPVLPRLTAQLRAGTVLFDNVDLLARVAAAVDLSDERAPKSSSSAGYLEAAGAFEVRLRRTLAVGGVVTTRSTRRVPVEPVTDVLGEASPLPADGTYGETSFLEAGATARISLGARSLTFAGEMFARRTRLAELYASATPDDPATAVLGQVTHLGGRASVDAWIGATLRVLARYEVVSKSDLAPEITGYKALRVIVEATF